MRTNEPHRSGWCFVFPAWFPTLLFATPPLIAARRWHRRRCRKTLTPGLCPTCHYDLRATPTLCPECGTKPPA